MYDAFISYSRKDKGFVDELVTFLVEKKCTCWLDKKDLPPAELWRDELKNAIVDSDNMIFIVSSSSIDSKHCNMELEYAAENNKRIIPVLFEDAENIGQIPEILSLRQWLEIDSSNIQKGGSSILKTINNEYKWRKQGTDYLRRAQNWEAGEGGLLPRVELEGARAWIESGAKIDPGPLELQIKYIHESEAFHLKEAEKWEALYAKSLAKQLAAQSEILVDQRGELLETAALLAVESMRRSPSLESDQAIRKSLFLLPRRIIYKNMESFNIKLTVISANGKYIASLCEDNSIHVWDCVSGDEVSCIKTLGARQILIGTSNQHILTLDHKATLWNISDGSEASILPIENAVAAAYSCDGGYLAMVGSENTTYLWDTSDYQLVARYQSSEPMQHVAIAPFAEEVSTWNHNAVEIFHSPGPPYTKLDLGFSSIVYFEYSPDGKRLAQVSPMDYTVRLFDTESKEILLFEDRHWSVAFSGNSKHFALASPEWDAYAYDLPSCWQAGHYWGLSSGTGMFNRNYVHQRVSCKRSNSVHHNDSVNKVTLSFSGKLMGTTSKDGTARVWEPYRGREVLRLLEKSVGPIRQIKFHADERLLTGWGEQSWSTWEAVGHRQVAALAHEDAVYDAAFSDDGNFIATISKDKTCRVWSMPDGDEVARIDIGNDLLLRTISISPDAKSLLIGDKYIVDVATRSTIVQLPETENSYLVKASCDWQYVIKVFKNKGLSIYNFEGPNEIANLPLAEVTVNALDVHSGKRIVALAVSQNWIGLWHWLQPENITKIETSDSARAIYFDNTSSKVAVLFENDKTQVELWGIEQRKLVRNFPHNSIVTSVAFEPKGEYVVTTSEDFTARIWSVESGDQIAQFKHDADIVMAQFSPDGKYVVSAGGRSDRVARVWYWRPEDLITETCSRLSRNLTKEEWQQYFGDEPYRTTCD